MVLCICMNIIDGGTLLFHHISYNTTEEHNMDVRLIHPFTMMVAGPTSCGKTHWTKNLLLSSKDLLTPEPESIVWFYGEYQQTYADLQTKLPNVTFVEGIPSSLDEYLLPNRPNLFVIDDLMAESGSNGAVAKLFTRGSHHKNLSVIYIVQNLFHKGRENRDISLNCHYLVLFKNPRDASQITTLAKQMYPGSVKFLQEAYRDATSAAHGYLFIDLKTNTPEQYRVRTQIMPGNTQYVYVRKI